MVARYSDLEFTTAIKNNTTLAAALRQLGLRPAGGNYANAKRKIRDLNIDTDHFVGQAWMRGVYKPFGKLTRTSSIKKHLVRERGHQCENEQCGRKTWLGQPIMLELEHIDGDRTNHVEDNLKLLCPNCHSQTTTWRGRNIKAG